MGTSERLCGDLGERSYGDTERDYLVTKERLYGELVPEQTLGLDLPQQQQVVTF